METQRTDALFHDTLAKKLVGARGENLARQMGEEGEKIGRGLPTNWLTRFLIRFAPEERLRPYRRMNGYALLRRGEAVAEV